MAENSEDKRTNKVPGLIPAHGGYRDLQSFQMSEIVYDASVALPKDFITQGPEHVIGERKNDLRRRGTPPLIRPPAPAFL